MSIKVSNKTRVALDRVLRANPDEAFEFLLSVMRGDVKTRTKRLAKQTGVEVEEDAAPDLKLRIEAAKTLLAYQHGLPKESVQVEVQDHREPNLKLLTSDDLTRLHELALKANAVDAEFAALPEGEK